MSAKQVREACQAGEDLPFVVTDDETEIMELVPLIEKAIIKIFH